MSAKPFRHSDRGESLSSCEKFGAGRIPEDHGRDSCRRSLSEFYCQNPLNLKVLNREGNASICSTECVNGSIGFIGFHREVQRKCRGSAEEVQRKCRGSAEEVQRKCRGSAEKVQRPDHFPWRIA